MPLFVADYLPYNLHAGLGSAARQGSLASVGAMGAGRADVGSSPTDASITISSRSQCAHGTNVDTHAALFALQVVFFIRAIIDPTPRSALPVPTRPCPRRTPAHSDSRGCSAAGSKYTTGDHCCSSLWFLGSMYFRFRGRRTKTSCPGVRTRPRHRTPDNPEDDCPAGNSTIPLRPGALHRCP